MAVETTPALSQFLSLLDQRQGAESVAQVDAGNELLLESLQELLAVLPTAQPAGLQEPVPREIAEAMALALYAQPYLAAIFGHEPAEVTPGLPSVMPPTPDAPIHFNTVHLQTVLGLADWLLDDLQQTIDRRVSGVLRQSRLVQWLWAEYGLPQGDPRVLFRVLFPAAPSQVECQGWCRVQGQLYAVVDKLPGDAPAEPVRSWVPRSGAGAVRPLFDPDRLEAGLVRHMAQGSGFTETRVRRTLARAVTVVELDGLHDAVRRGWWAHGPPGQLTGLVPSPHEVAALASPLYIDAIDPAPLRDEASTDRAVRTAFDAQAVPRLTAVMRTLYAEALGRIGSIPGTQEEPPVSLDDVDLYDLAPHLARVQQPLLDWVGNEGDGELERASRLWHGHFRSAWQSVPREGRRPSVRARVTANLMRSNRTLRETYHRHPLPRASHGDLMLLFTSHLMASAHPTTLWSDDDILGRWFWTCWDRLCTEGAEDTMELDLANMELDPE